MQWRVESNLQLLEIGDELLVAEWYCPGAAQRWRETHSAEHGIELQREGVHLRRSGRSSVLIDPLCAAAQRKGDDYAFAFPTAQPQASTLLLLRGELAERLMPRSAPPPWRLSAECRRLHFLLLQARDSVQRQELAVALLGKLSHTAGSSEPVSLECSSRNARLADAMRQFMAASFRQPLTLETIARHSGSSAFHAARVFRKVTGSTVHRHLTQLRLHAAMFRTREFAGRLTELGLASGFSSHSHFSAAFKAEFGIAPTDVALSLRAMPPR